MLVKARKVCRQLSYLLIMCPYFESYHFYYGHILFFGTTTILYNKYTYDNNKPYNKFISQLSITVIMAQLLSSNTDNLNKMFIV